MPCCRRLRPGPRSNACRSYSSPPRGAGRVRSIRSTRSPTRCRCCILSGRPVALPTRPARRVRSVGDLARARHARARTLSHPRARLRLGSVRGRVMPGTGTGSGPGWGRQTSLPPVGGVAISPRFSCRECGHAEPRWFSQCVKCLSFGTLRAVGVAGTAVAEDIGMVTMNPAAVHAAPPASRRQMIPVVAASSLASPLPPHTRPIVIAPIESMPLSAARIAQATAPRTATGMPELDRVLGGGVRAHRLVRAARWGRRTRQEHVALAGRRQARARRPGRDCVLYATGEENAEAIALRAQRLGIDNDLVHVVATDDLDAILDLATANKASALVIDSIQKMRSEDLDLTSSAASRLPVTVAKLAYFAHGAGIPVIAMARSPRTDRSRAPKSMEHDVDVVLYLEGAGGARRRLVALKNRSGSADEVGMFEMRESGLVCIEDTSGLPERAAGVPGSAVFPMVVGERVQLVEVQALVGGPKSDERPARRAFGVRRRPQARRDDPGGARAPRGDRRVRARRVRERDRGGPRGRSRGRPADRARDRAARTATCRSIPPARRLANWASRARSARSPTRVAASRKRSARGLAR